MKGVFGKALSYTFYPQENGSPIQLPSQTPAIYVFDREPSRYDAINGVAPVIETITAWTVSSDSPYGCSFTISAIDDPRPNESGSPFEDYYLGINFITQAAGDSQCVIKQFILERPLGGDSIPGTTIATIKNIFPAIAEYASDSELTSFLATAEADLKLMLKNRGIEFHRAQQLEDLNLPLAYKTLSMVCLSQVQSEGDRFDIKAGAYQAWYKNHVNAIELPIDQDLDGISDAKKVAKPRYVLSSM